MSLQRKNIVIIGGGNGTGILISSLKQDFNITAIVSMADDGGSTGRLREELGTSAVGDIRQCLVALAGSETSQKLFSYRYGNGDLKGHSFGNIFLTTIENATGSLYKAIDQAKNILEIKNGEVIPVTDNKPNLVMDYKEKKTTGVYRIANTEIDGKKADFELNPSNAKLSQKAREHIEKADLIIIAPGNFYCSIIPALIVGGLTSSVSEAKAKKVLVSNLVNFTNHTEGFATADYLSEIYRITKTKFIDIVIANNNYSISSGEEAVKIERQTNQGVKIIEDNLISDEKNKIDPNDKIAQVRSKTKHDKIALNKIITQISKS